MAERIARVRTASAIRVGPFRFDRTHPAEKACAAYILAAPGGERAARMRRLILMGHAALVARHSRKPHDHEEP